MLVQLADLFLELLKVHWLCCHCRLGQHRKVFQFRMRRCEKHGDQRLALTALAGMEVSAEVHLACVIGS